MLRVLGVLPGDACSVILGGASPSSLLLLLMLPGDAASAIHMACIAGAANGDTRLRLLSDGSETVFVVSGTAKTVDLLPSRPALAKLAADVDLARFCQFCCGLPSCVEEYLMRILA